MKCTGVWKSLLALCLTAGLLTGSALAEEFPGIVVSEPTVVNEYDVELEVIGDLTIGGASCSCDLADLSLDDATLGNSCHTHTFGTWLGTYEEPAVYQVSGNGWSFDYDSSTLTLNGYTGSGISVETDLTLGYEGTVTIKLIGENVINTEGNENQTTRGIYVDGLNLEIQGPGTLTINATDCPIQVTGNGLNDARVAGRLILSDGATLTTNSGFSPLSAKEVWIESGSVLYANTSNERNSAVSATNYVINGSMIATSPYDYGAVMAGYYLTPADNVILMAGDSAETAVLVAANSKRTSDTYGEIASLTTREHYMAYLEDGLMPEEQSSTEASTTEPTTPTGTTATLSDTKLMVNGTSVAVDAYMINDNNYIKLRDLATMVNGTDKNFEVTWNGDLNAIELKSASTYTSVGGEMAFGTGTDTTASLSTASIFLDGVEVNLTAYTIDDNNYFKLRDVMVLFDIGVGYDSATATATLDTTLPYTD